MAYFNIVELELVAIIYPRFDPGLEKELIRLVQTGEQFDAHFVFEHSQKL